MEAVWGGGGLAQNTGELRVALSRLGGVVWGTQQQLLARAARYMFRFSVLGPPLAVLCLLPGVPGAVRRRLPFGAALSTARHDISLRENLDER